MYGSNFCIVTLQPALDEQPPKRRGGDALPERRDDAAGDEDVLGRVRTRVHSFTSVVRASGLRPVAGRPGCPRRAVAGSARSATPIAEPVMQRPELLQPLGQLRRARLEAGPASQRRAGVGVEPEVLPVESRRLGSPASRRCGIGRAREVERPASRVGHHLHPRGIVRQRGIERRGRGADVVALGDPIDGARQRLAREERLVALHVDDRVEAGELVRRGNLRHAVGAGEVPAAGQHGAHARRARPPAPPAASRWPRPARPPDHAPGRAGSPG